MKNPTRRLELVLNYGKKAQQFLHEKSFLDWQNDEQLRFAVSHALAGVAENIKEYMLSIDKNELLNSYPHIRWNQIARFRDKMVHHYESIDQNILYEFATDDMDELLQVVQDILKVNHVDEGHGFSFIQTSKL